MPSTRDGANGVRAVAARTKPGLTPAESPLEVTAHVAEIAHRLTRARALLEERVWADYYIADVTYLLKRVQPLLGRQAQARSRVAPVLVGEDAPHAVEAAAVPADEASRSAAPSGVARALRPHA